MPDLEWSSKQSSFEREVNLLVLPEKAFLLTPEPSSPPLPMMGEEGGSEKTYEGKRANVVLLSAFWLLGMCNNFGYVVMLSAAHDLLSSHDHGEAALPLNSTGRICNHMSTGAILLADIVPSVLVKLLSPFFPLWIHLRLATTVITSLLGFFLVASKIHYWLVILGVVMTSISSGVGESSLLMYMPFFKNKNVISAWSSGTGGAGVFGSLSYLGLTSMGVNPATSIYIMLSVPVLMAFVFWVMLDRPDTGHLKQESSDDIPTHEDTSPFKGKLKLCIKILLVYMLPFGLVYLFEYFINQGLSELIYFENIFIDPPTQYRWYSLDYQVGVLISRSSVNLLKVDNTWLLAVLQGINVVIMTTEAIYRWVGNFWIVILLILWEGLLGGCSYVNTYRRINQEMPPDQRQFSMSMNSFGDAIGITLAGMIAIPVHNAICKLPPP